MTQVRNGWVSDYMHALGLVPKSGGAAETQDSRFPSHVIVFCFSTPTTTLAPIGGRKPQNIVASFTSSIHANIEQTEEQDYPPLVLLIFSRNSTLAGRNPDCEPS